MTRGGGGSTIVLRHTRHTAPVIMLYCCAAVPGLSVYFINVDVDQLVRAAVMDMSVSVVDTFDHLSSLWSGPTTLNV